MSELILSDHVVQDDEIIRTQISGKYSPDNFGVFEFKQQLVVAGLDVRFPVGDEIIEYECGFAITVPHEKTTPFPRTEVQFLREIKTIICRRHTICTAIRRATWARAPA